MLARFLLLTLLTLSLTNCSRKFRSLSHIKQSGKLYVLTINSETTFYENRDGKRVGFEYEMIKLFAESIQVEPVFIIKDSVEDLINGLNSGAGDIIAAGLTETAARRDHFIFGPHYIESQPKVVCQKYIQPRNLTELQKYEIAIGTRTSYLERLEQLKQEYHGLNWKEVNGQATASLIQGVHNKEYECTVADSQIVQVYGRYFPDISIPLDLGTPQNIAWMMPKGSTQLQSQLFKWSKKNRNTQLKRLKDSYFLHTKEFDPFDFKTLSRRIKTRLPKYKELLQKAAAKYGYDWALLAAISYQESHWNPKARSPTGVRGFMMLTNATAPSLNIEDRLDPEESIMGGAQYLRQLSNRIPSYIPEPDRKWMTLAAYNIGLAHLRDARGLAAWQNKNPNTWAGVRDVLPLLSSRKHYKRLPHGYARGLEPVLYINRIRNYQSIIKKSLSEIEAK